MTSLRSNFPDILDESFRRIIQTKYGTWEGEYEKLFNITTSKKQSEKDSAISGFGTMPTKSEGVGITYDDPYQGYDVTYTHSTYGMGFRVSMEMYEDDQFRAFTKMTKALTRSAMNAVEVACGNIFNRAFNASYTGGDSLELCSLVHTLTGGGTEQNELTTPADLSVSSLQQAIMDMEDTIDDRSLPVVVKAKTLLVPTELKFVAPELLKSTKKPYTANNEVNALQDEDLSFTVNHYLTDPDAWFLLADKSDHELWFFWRMKPKEDSDVDFDTKDLKFSLVQRFSVGWSDWRGVFGTPGAG